jgi:rhodanese-related sulfurtransferase
MSIIQINSQEAFELLKKDNDSALIDVRTQQELDSVGIVDAVNFNDRMILLPWQLFPEMKENPNFATDLEEALLKLFGSYNKNLKLFLMCRSGYRSNAAANYLKNIGYKNCYNLLNGFEGDLDQDGQRGNINGWKSENLAWRYN